MSPRELRASVSLASIFGLRESALVIFFADFNVLEAKLPALASRAATGAYSSVQFLGTFFRAAGCGASAVAWNMGDFIPAAMPASRT